MENSFFMRGRLHFEYLLGSEALLNIQKFSSKVRKTFRPTLRIHPRRKSLHINIVDLNEICLYQIHVYTSTFSKRS
jgi:hypothetical protein